jgi:hypothetical protein
MGQIEEIEVIFVVMRKQEVLQEIHIKPVNHHVVTGIRGQIDAILWLGEVVPIQKEIHPGPCPKVGAALFHGVKADAASAECARNRLAGRRAKELESHRKRISVGRSFGGELHLQRGWRIQKDGQLQLATN